jgi:hypothetical protein
MKYYIVEYSRMINEENDGRKKPKYLPYTQWSCLYENLDDAESFSSMCLYDCFEVKVYEAPLTLLIDKKEAAE